LPGLDFIPNTISPAGGRANAALLILDARLNLLRYRPTQNQDFPKSSSHPKESPVSPRRGFRLLSPSLFAVKNFGETILLTRRKLPETI
jgi:hypothetical protein